MKAFVGCSVKNSDVNENAETSSFSASKKTTLPVPTAENDTKADTTTTAPTANAKRTNSTSNQIELNEITTKRKLVSTTSKPVQTTKSTTQHTKKATTTSSFSISMYFVVKETVEDKKQYEVFENIVSSVQIEDDNSDYTDEQLKKYIELNTENSDFVGWIKIDGTHINYPVMKSNTPDYYLHRNFNKEYSYYGTPYLSDKSDTMKPTDNIVIYSHNMRDNTMFGDLSKYKSKEFYEKHRYIHFDTLVDLGKYEIVCVFKTTPSKFDYQNYTVFDSPDEFSSYISKCKKTEYYNTDVSCSYGDKLVTLSTCEYSQENGRLVVVAKKVK